MGCKAPQMAGLQCTPATAWASQIPAGKRELMAEPSALLELPSKAAAWHFSLVCHSNLCAPPSNREQLPPGTGLLYFSSNS